MPRFTKEAVNTKQTKKKRGGARGFSHISRAPPHNGRRRPQRYIYYSVPTKLLLVYHQHEASPKRCGSNTLSKPV